MLTAKSISESGSFAVMPEDRDSVMLVGMENDEGKVYSKYSPLTPVLMAPFARVGLWLSKLAPEEMPRNTTVLFCCSFANGLLTAITISLLFILCLAFGLNEKISVCSASAYGLCTMALPYAKYCFSEPSAALFTTLCLYGLALYRRDGSMRHLLIAAAAAAFIPLSRFMLSVSAIPIIALALCRRPALKGGAIVATGFALGAALHLVFNFVRFHSFLETGYGSQASWLNPSLIPGIYGNLVSSDKSFFVYTPLMLLFIPGLFAGIRRKLAPEVLCILFILASYIVLFSLFGYWGGGHSWGPRYLLPIMPGCTAAAALLLDRRTKHNEFWKKVFIVLAAAGFVIQLSAVSAKYFVNYENNTVQANINEAYSEGKLFWPPGAPRFVPLKRQFAYAYKQYSYSFSHLRDFFKPASTDYNVLLSDKIVERSPDFWLPLLWVSSGWKLRAGALAVFLALCAGAIISLKRLLMELKT